MWCLFTHYLSMGEEVCCSGMQVVLVKVFIPFLLLFSMCYCTFRAQNVLCINTLAKRCEQYHGEFLNFLQMSHIKFCIICRPALPFLDAPNCSKDEKLLGVTVHPSTYLKPYMARCRTLESNVGGAQISMDKEKWKMQSWQASRTEPSTSQK